MFQNYINNLYKNLIFYRIENIADYKDYLQKKSLNVLKGGTLDEKLASLDASLSEMNEQNKKIVAEIKENPIILSLKNKDSVILKKSTIKEIVDMIKINFDTIKNERTQLETSINKLTSEEHIKIIQSIITSFNEIDNTFKEII